MVTKAKAKAKTAVKKTVKTVKTVSQATTSPARKMQWQAAQDRRREALQSEGKKLLQGVVSKRVWQGIRLLKVELELNSIGDVMELLLDEWRKRHGKQ